jgi:hypothetical protein
MGWNDWKFEFLAGEGEFYVIYDVYYGYGHFQTNHAISTGDSFSWLNGPGMTLTTYCDLVARLRIYGAVLPLRSTFNVLVL